MISIFHTRNEFLVCIVDDWAFLRKSHRIIGEIVGDTGFIPSLPMRLFPEEVLFLLSKELAEVRELQMGSNAETEMNSLKKYEDELLDHQLAAYRENRKAQLEAMLEKIVTNRRKLGDNRSEEEILNEELEKSTTATKTTMLWPIFLQSKQPHVHTLSLEDVLKLTSELKFRVYKDLHERGYFVTRGEKFGGHFLVYFGDPICYHAIFIIKCLEKDEKVWPTEVVSFGRLGTSVRKRAVMASLVDDQVHYVTVTWIDA